MYCENGFEVLDPSVGAAFDELGITHLLSIVEITNPDDVGLALLGVADQASARYLVWVYGT